MAILISIIVPIYKVEPYLRQCLDSIVNQTYTNLEIILVDDGSPDGCPAICDEYAAKDNRIIVIHKENGGLSDARNAGLDICKGEYISFVDSDDCIKKCYIEQLLTVAKKEIADIVIGKYLEVKEIPIPNIEPTKQKYSVFNSSEALQHLCSFDIKEMMASWGKLYKHSLFSKIRFPVGKIYEDAHTNYRLYHKAAKVCLIEDVLYFYRLRSDSIMGQTTSSIHALEALVERYFFLKACKESEAAKLCLPVLCWDLLFAFSQSKFSKGSIPGFKNANEILKKYRITVKDYESCFNKNFFHLTALKVFAIFPSLYLLYRKIFPIHLRDV